MRKQLIVLGTWALVVPAIAWLTYVVQYGGCDSSAPCHAGAMGYATAMALYALPWGLVLMALIVNVVLQDMRSRRLRDPRLDAVQVSGRWQPGVDRGLLRTAWAPGSLVALLGVLMLVASSVTYVWMLGTIGVLLILASVAWLVLAHWREATQR